jgi:hypothetical protein
LNKKAVNKKARDLLKRPVVLTRIGGYIAT